jgi:CHAT domain-containing protein
LGAAEKLGTKLSSQGKDIVILSAFVTDKGVWSILTTPTHQVAGYTKKAEAELDRLVLQFCNELQEQEADPRGLAREFYDILVKPVEKELTEAAPRTVVWMLDGTLRYLPPAALYDGERYLVERYASVELTVASLLDLEASSAAWRALGLGVSEGYEGFKPLPEVPGELQAVVRDANSPGGALPGVRLLDEKFTRQALENSRGAGYQVIHIASHFNCTGKMADSFLLLGDGSHLTVAAIHAQRGMFEGLELLTLSACNTAMGKEEENGREVDGLGDEAQKQGAKAVMATLWPVVDVSTAELMGSFYRLKEQGLEKAEALRQAQLALLHGDKTKGASGSFTHPRFWAPFILIGNWK